jgi:hypothetical protein
MSSWGNFQTRGLLGYIWKFKDGQMAYLAQDAKARKSAGMAKTQAGIGATNAAKRSTSKPARFLNEAKFPCADGFTHFI